MNHNSLKSFVKKWRVALIAGVLAIIGGGIAWYSLRSPSNSFSPVSVELLYNPYVSAHPSGIISTRSSLRLRLAEAVADSAQIGQEVPYDLFRLSPSVKGKTYWTDARTAEFIPDNYLAPNTEYQVKINLKSLFPEADEEYATFDFSVHTMEQNFAIDVEGLSPYELRDLKRQKLTGIFRTADFAEDQQVEAALQAYQEGKLLSVTWNHAADGTLHQFTVEEIQRGEAASEVILESDGEALDVDREDDTKVEVPALGDFKITQSEVVQGEEQYVLLHFSDPLQESQDLNGLIRLNTVPLKFIVEENRVKVYPTEQQAGTQELSITRGVKNILGYPLPNTTTVSLSFAQTKPSVRLVGDGVILPSTQGLIMPFEAVGLKAIDVSIVRIFEENVGQFLQKNQYDGNQELRRVGRPVLKKTIALNADGITNLSNWNRFTLDLAEVIQVAPGAIYQVMLSFRKQNALYGCNDEANEEDESIYNDQSWDEPETTSYYDDEYYYDYYPDDYDWSERDNPCHVSYYNQRRFVKKNLFASNLGMIAKQGEDGKLWAIITDLRDAKPLSGVKLKVLDYQQQTIAEGKTNGDGIAQIEVPHRPFLLVADHDQQKGYLRLDDGSSLTLSNFNVAGQAVQEGVKGYLYGERGVWRPGDSLHLAFMLEDREKILPDNHPVIFELSDPQGNKVQRQVATASTEGLYYFGTETSQDAPTGNWTARVKVGGATFTKNVKIETIKPNRLKIDLDFGTKRLTAQDGSIRGKLKVNWLTGATARNLKAKFDVILSSTKTVFDGFENFSFDDMARAFNTTEQPVFEGKLNESGEATFTAALEVNEKVPGALKATFTGKVFEEGGDFSIDQFSLPYYSYKSFVGVNVPKTESPRDALLTDKTQTVGIALVDANGKPLSRDGIEVSLYKLGWRWWWDQSEENVSNFVERSHREPVEEGVVSVENGRGYWDFMVKKPSWGRYYVRACDPVSGHCAGDAVYIDWPGYSGRANREEGGGATLLRFSADKESYEVGEKATINIPSSQESRALVSIENGSRVLGTYWVDAQAGETAFSFSLTEEMTPNVYVHVSLLQKHTQTTNDRPIRLYGVTPIEVTDPMTQLEPVIKMPPELGPFKQASIQVSEASGKPMAYTVALVDEGLLDITRFTTPQPWDYFYAKEALGVKTWDLYDYVIGAYGGELERIMAIGGDDALANAGKRKAQRFKPVVKFMGPFFLKKGQKQTHTFTMPNYVGSVRTMVVAGYEGAYGNVEQATPVVQPLMVLGTLPRVLGPGEEVRLPANVFAMDASVKNVKVGVETNALLATSGQRSQSLTFAQTGDQMADFSIKVKPQVGIGTVKITASSGQEKATYDIELDVRNPNPPVTDVINQIIQPGESWNTSYQPIGMLGTNRATLEVSSMPPINLEKRLRYLLQYPYGCVEQTTSSVFPQLYVQNIVKLPESQAVRLDGNIKAGINRLLSFTTSDGGFAYWPGQDDANDWGTNYAGHFLLEAQKQGYVIPQAMLNHWKEYQQSRASRWASRQDRPRDDLIQAYRLYTLALADSPDQGAMNRLRERNDLSNQARWRLAAAYVLVGQPEAAREIVNNVSTEVKPYRELSYTYGSGLRDEAMILETLSLMDERSRGLDLVRKISSNLSAEDRWMSTQTTAYCLLAVSEFIGSSPQDKNMRLVYQVNQKSAEELQSTLPIVQQTIASEGGKLLVKNEGEGVLYTRLIQEGTPLAGAETNAENDLRLSVIYKDQQGQIINPEQVQQGTDFVAEVTVANPGARGSYQELALTQIFPSGWEILNMRLNDLDQAQRGDTPTYQDIRDDRVYTYFDLSANERKTFKVLLNASYVGRFYLPAVKCEAMYDHTISARKAGQWVEVVE